MRIELRRELYQVTYESLDWLCIAERLADWSACHAWPEERDYEREAVVAWAKGVYDASISHRQRITLTMPREWVGWMWRVLADTPDDEFPSTIKPMLIGQIRQQNGRKARLP